MTIRDRLKAAALFILAWLNTPTSRAGIVTILTAVIGERLAPNVIEGIVQGLIVVAGAVLVAWPQKPQP